MMKDINTKKSTPKDDLPERKRASRANEIEEIYHGNSVNLNNMPETKEPSLVSQKDWYRESVSSNHTSRYDWKFWAGLVAVLVLFLGGVFAFTKIFGRVTLLIVPTQGDMILSGATDALLSSNASSTDSSLSFSTISSVEDTEKRLVNATGQETVSKKAEGTIIISNSSSANSQKLSVNTRFQAPDGKIYRLKEAATVKGYTKKGKDIIPGTTEAVVAADVAGAEYNRGLTDFTIPGFANTPKFKTITAKSKTDMTGGFVGTVKKVAQADLDSNRSEIQKILKDRIIKKATQDIPADFILFPDAMKIKYEDVVMPNQDQLPAGKAYVAIKATLTGVIFDRAKLSHYFAQKLIPNYDGSPVVIVNFDKLDFALQNKDILDLTKVSKVTFTLEGKAHVVWTFPLAKLQKRLAGVGREEMHKILADEFSAINTVTPTFFPPWLWTFPSDPSKIKLDIDNGVKGS
jgi:hypothetical protein